MCICRCVCRENGYCASENVNFLCCCWNIVAPAPVNVLTVDTHADHFFHFFFILSHTHTHRRKYGKKNATMKWYLCCDKSCRRTIKHLSVINLFRIRSLSAASSNSDKTSHPQCWSLIHSHSSSISSLFVLSFSCTSYPFALQRKCL